MIENDVIQRPAKNIITVLGKHTVMQTNSVMPSRNPNSAALITLAKLNIQQTVLYPGQSLYIKQPNNLPDGPVLVDIRQPRFCNQTPTIQETNDEIIINNNTKEPFVIPDDINVVDVISCSSVDVQAIQTKPHEPTMINKVPDISKIKIETSGLTQNQIDNLNHIHHKYKNVFDGNLTGYNGYFGKHLVSLQWADESRPKTNRIHPPTWSSSKDIMLQKKIDQLTEMGVLADPYQHNVQVKCIHPCFLQKKARAADKSFEDSSLDELRFLTAPNAVNDKCRQIQTKVPDQNEIFKFLGNNKYVIFADLFESFFQNHLDKEAWGYVAINSPYKGLRVYTRSTQGLLNQDEELGQLLSKVLGDEIMQGHCMKIADDLIVGGQTIDEALHNWSSVLEKLDLSNLKLSPGKVRCFPKETTIYGWSIQNGKMTPDPHRKLALSKTKHTDIKTVTDLRSWIGIYKTFLIAMPGIAETMDTFDKLIAGVKDGKAAIQWTPHLIHKFNEATEKVKDSNQFLTLPRREEQLIMMPDATVREPAVGFTLNIIRDGNLLPVIYYSFKLNDCQNNWWPCEREALAVATAIKKCSHYILNSTMPTLILTDSKPVVEAFNLMKRGKFSTSSRMAAFLHSANQYKVDIQHISGKYKQNIAPDYLSRNPAVCPNKSCQLCTFIKETAASVVAATDITTIPTALGHEVNNYTKTGPLLIQSFGSEHMYTPANPNALPLGNTKSWAQLQQQDFACCEALKRLTSGQQPNKRGPMSNDIRRYFNACQAKDLLVVQEKIPNTTQTRSRIVVPKDFVPAVIAQLHHREANHPSTYQLEKLFNRHYFGIHVKQAIIETVENCTLCKSNKHMKPYITQFLPTSNPDHPGKVFNIDVMKRNYQKVMVCRDLFSSYTTTSIIKTEQAQCLLNGIIECVTDIRHSGHITIRTDSAPGFNSLVNNPALEKLKINLEITDPANKNSIGTVDNAIKELEDELIKLSPHDSSVNKPLLSLATRSMNTKIRNRGLTASEILFSRDENTQTNLNIQDDDLAKQQIQIKTVNNNHSANTRFKSSKEQPMDIKKGDTIALISDKDKTKSRDVFLVTDTMNKNIQINKIMKYQSPNPKIQTKPRIVPNNAVFQITRNYIPSAPTPTPKTYFQQHQKKQKHHKTWSPYTKHCSDSDDDTIPPADRQIRDQNANDSDNDDDQDNNDGVDNDQNDGDDHNDDNDQNDNDHNDDGNEDNNDDQHKDRQSTPIRNDPYQDLRVWETSQIEHAKGTLDKTNTNSLRSIQNELRSLIDDLDESYKEMCSPNPDNNPPNEGQDNLEWDYFTPTQSFQFPPNLNKVQDVDKLYEAAAHQMENIDTNKVQNLNDVLPIPKSIERKKKKARVSPPQNDLPLETGTKTRSQKKKKRVSPPRNDLPLETGPRTRSQLLKK